LQANPGHDVEVNSAGLDFVIYILHDPNERHQRGRLPVMSVKMTTSSTIEQLLMSIWSQYDIPPQTYSLRASVKWIGDGYFQSQKIKIPSVTTVGEMVQKHKSTTFALFYKPELDDDGYFSSKSKTSQMGRLDTMKQCFHAYINRAQAYGTM
jgi:hypothetical protein